MITKKTTTFQLGQIPLANIIEYVFPSGTYVCALHISYDDNTCSKENNYESAREKLLGKIPKASHVLLNYSVCEGFIRE